MTFAGEQALRGKKPSGLRAQVGPVKCSSAAKADVIIQNVFYLRDGKIGSGEHEEIRRKWALTGRKKYGIIFKVLPES